MTTPPPIATRIAIVEDNASFRQELVKFLDDGTRFVVTGSYKSAEGALDGIPAETPEVILMDINLPNASGIECASRIKEVLPDVQILMLTVYEDTETIFKALQAGATGYLLKRATPARIMEAILEIKQGGSPMSSHIARKVVESFKAPASPSVKPEASQLTPRELEILGLLAGGSLYKEIAAALDISYATVRTHVERIYKKLHVRSRAQAVAKAGRR
ncbi:response regulator [Singulisphaera sp. PoT]|uniref:response regulator n=1 Tax=Singulisphaera sp. PoT TaxID=3411797 RepID=UPI003BF5971D